MTYVLLLVAYLQSGENPPSALTTSKIGTYPSAAECVKAAGAKANLNLKYGSPNTNDLKISVLCVAGNNQ